ncbi:uncharacterized protein LOC132742452 isoform X1 [Ruditapes philippinarum]|uniref:uncharacterized protein LOC132742452 isoform X1 n=1 Tax=Ruditapes philippinarum TaxID=129788 RepID=UPI00295BA89D|nr:uncharacterized protein LOC132742452 isoform X1 [Ruditapes philippinarum]
MTLIMLSVSVKTVLIFLVILVPGFYVASGSKCTNVLKKTEVLEVVVKEPCIQKYTARCGWLSLNYCTFYHNTHCDKKVNETIEKYYVKTDCCKGFFMAMNGTCIEKKPGVVYHDIKPTPQVSVSSAVDPNHKELVILGQKTEKKVKMEISGGGYAGIACGLVLIITIAAFIFIAVQKRKKKKQSMKTHMANQVIYEAGNQPIVRNAGSSRTPSVQFSRSSREATPSSSRMVTPPTSPTSPIKTTVPVEQPLINKTLTEDDIPESNV